MKFYTEVGHDGQCEAWVIRYDENDLRFDEGKYDEVDDFHYYNGPHSDDVEMWGRVGHDKQEVSLSTWNEVSQERVKYVTSLLAMDYPGYKLWTFIGNNGSPKLTYLEPQAINADE